MGFSKTLFSITSLIAGIVGAAMVIPMIFALATSDMRAAAVFGIPAAVCAPAGFFLFKKIPGSKRELQARDAYLVVLLSWIVCSLIGLLPYYLGGVTDTFSDALFESVAGFTTTGASVLGENTLSDPFLLWKAITHWLGAMGILIFVITILPTIASGSQRIVSAESPGAGLSTTVPRSKDLAKLLYLIYSALTLAEFLLLWLGSDMSPFEALINSLGSISTAGLTHHPSGIAHYDSLFVEIVMCVFTLLASVNFMLFIFIIRRNFSHLRHNTELKVFLGIIAVSTLLISADLTANGTFPSFGASVRNAFFTVCSFMTTSGLKLNDYTVWPVFCQMILFSMLFIGGCVASTSGSVKVLRVVTMAKIIKRGLFKRLHPRSVKAVRIGDDVITPAMMSSVTGFVTLYLVTFLIGTVVLSFQGLDPESTMGAVASLMSTTGSSFGVIGASADYSMFCAPLKIFICGLMLVGRLELYTVFLIFFPSFWNPNRARTN